MLVEHSAADLVTYDARKGGPGWIKPCPIPTLEQLFESMSAEDRPVLELSLQGYTTREISEQLGRAERTVRLLREGVRKRLQRMQQESP